MAVQLGYKEVYRYPTGFPEWLANGMPVASAPAGAANFSPPPQSGWGLVWALFGVFLGGIALNLTPCVYPIIPITVSYFGGRGGGKSSSLAHGLCYVCGLALTYSLLGVVAALTGGLMGAALQNPIVLLAVAAVLLAFAASLFGRVVTLATEQFAAVKVDLTNSDNPLNERLLREYAIKGVPTIVFLGTDGRELPALRLVDYLPAHDFQARMQGARVSR